ncbi:DUF1905 domain-containing protein [Mesorhizobium huakuii]|uniref:DUF1905 domain-containing protein n=1 Tax=Mesorhizobium huakuii TaxID=28104 RepID=A0ABZ0VQ72_9HYPH|nr:DUF1905 domain-containing protein [Mesorhizobium huakuii]WQB98429.1 DUF1905 domain-containing protein [Mesorhizobium huakuii]
MAKRSRKSRSSRPMAWGVIPVEATIDGFTFGTSLFPKDGTYLLPLKDDVRRKCNLTAGDSISISVAIHLRGR